MNIIVWDLLHKMVVVVLAYLNSLVSAAYLSQSFIANLYPVRQHTAAINQSVGILQILILRKTGLQPKVLGAVHKLRHPIRGYGGVSQKMIEGREGIWQKMTDDDDEAGGRTEKTITAL